jgi:hypothetical protein
MICTLAYMQVGYNQPDRSSLALPSARARAKLIIKLRPLARFPTLVMERIALFYSTFLLGYREGGCFHSHGNEFGVLF